VNFFILKRVIKKQKPDMIHINNGGYPGAESCRTMVLSAVSAGLKPILFTINNMAVKPKGLLDRYLDAFIGRNVTNFVTASKAASSRLSNHRKFPKEKLEVIHNTVLHDASINVYSPVLRDEFNLSKDHVIIGSLGLLIERKGYHYLIEAAHHIQDKDNWSIFIFGEGEERHNLEKLIEKYHLSEKVFLPGFRENPINYLLDFDAFILPSIRNEDQPNVISEAMLFSKAIISTHVAGIPEQVDHGKTGYLCKPKSIKELTESMDSIINMSPKVRLEMGKQAHEKYLNEFSYDKSMQKYFHLYNKLSQI
jgi:glycosyltransferase involved in cell wall biosynthesis